MFNTVSKSLKAVSVALAISLTSAVAVPPAFAGDSDNSPEMSGRYNWQTEAREARNKRWDKRGSYSRHRGRDRHYNRYNRRHRDYRHYRRHRNNDAGAAILGGIIGLGAGLAIGSANNRSNYDGGYYRAWSPEWYRYCQNRYRSFNPRTGYFLGYDGEYHFCRAR